MRRVPEWQPRRIEEWIRDALDVPMVLLSIVFLILAVVDATVPLPPGVRRLVSLAQWVIWTVFAIEFVVMWALARDKAHYLRRNWLAAASVVLPFLRVFRVFRALRALRTLKVFRLVAITGRASRQVGGILKARGAGYVTLLTLFVTLFGATGMYLIERDAPRSNIRSFGDALWWSAASITTIGSSLAPVTGEGRVLAVVIFTLGMVLIGYITAVLASYFVGRDLAPQPQALQTNREIEDTAGEAPADEEDLRAKVDRLIGLMERRASERDDGQST